MINLLQLEQNLKQLKENECFLYMLEEGDRFYSEHEKFEGIDFRVICRDRDITISSGIIEGTDESVSYRMPNQSIFLSDKAEERKEKYQSIIDNSNNKKDLLIETISEYEKIYIEDVLDSIYNSGIFDVVDISIITNNQNIEFHVHDIGGNDNNFIYNTFIIIGDEIQNLIDVDLQSFLEDNNIDIYTDSLVNIGSDRLRCSCTPMKNSDSPMITFRKVHSSIMNFPL